MKLIKTLLITGLLAVSLSAKASFSFTFVVNAGTFTNIFANFNNPVQVQQVIVASAAGSAGAALFVDTPTNWLSYTNLAYTNTISYATNVLNTWTNFYGFVQSNLVFELVDVTNNLVPPTTNAWPEPLYLTAGTNTTVTYPNLSATFDRGIWVTNTGTGPATLTVLYR